MQIEDLCVIILGLERHFPMIDCMFIFRETRIKLKLTINKHCSLYHIECAINLLE